MGVPLYVICHFSLIAFNYFSLSLIFGNLITLCLVMFLLGFILYGTRCASWTWVAISFPMLGKFLTIISSNIFSGPFSLSSPSGIPIMQMLLHLIFSILWVTHPAVMGFDFTVIVPLLPSHCGFSFVFGWGVSFLVSSSVFLSMIAQQLVVILVFSQEGVRARLSTPPSLFLSTNPFHNPHSKEKCGKRASQDEQGSLVRLWVSRQAWAGSGPLLQQHLSGTAPVSPTAKGLQAPLRSRFLTGIFVRILFSTTF